MMKSQLSREIKTKLLKSIGTGAVTYKDNSTSKFEKNTDEFNV